MGVDADAVRELGASDFETAVVTIGTAVEAGILATYVLVDLNPADVGQGDHRIVRRDPGTRRRPPRGLPRARHGHPRRAHLDRTHDRLPTYRELDPHFALVETTVPQEVAGTTPAKAEIRSR